MVEAMTNLFINGRAEASTGKIQKFMLRNQVDSAKAVSVARSPGSTAPARRWPTQPNRCRRSTTRRATR